MVLGIFITMSGSSDPRIIRLFAVFFMSDVCTEKITLTAAISLPVPRHNEHRRPRQGFFVLRFR